MKYAIVEIGAQQYKVSENQKIQVPKINKEVGEEIRLAKVYLFKDDDKILLDKQDLEKVKVVARIDSHTKGKKIYIMKFKRKKHYRRKKGYRPKYTILKIEKIELEDT